MPISAIAAGIEPIVSHITSPPTAKARDPLPSTAQNSTPLEELSCFGLKSHDDRYHASMTPAGAQTPREASSFYNSGVETPMTPHGLEMSSPPQGAQTASVVASFGYPKMNKWRVYAAGAIFFGNGLSDASAGALLPYMETYYNIGYAIVSLIFVTNAAGFILAAFFTQPTLRMLGRAKSTMAAEILIIVGYVMIACTPPFAVVVCAFFFLGLGMAFTLALNNVFCANLANATVIVGVVQGVYGESPFQCSSL